MLNAVVNKRSLCVNKQYAFTVFYLTDSCPDESSSQKTETIDLNSFTHDSAADVVQLLDTISSSQGGMEGLLEMISSSVAKLREN